MEKKIYRYPQFLRIWLPAIFWTFAAGNEIYLSIFSDNYNRFRDLSEAPMLGWGVAFVILFGSLFFFFRKIEFNGDSFVFSGILCKRVFSCDEISKIVEYEATSTKDDPVRAKTKIYRYREFGNGTETVDFLIKGYQDLVYDLIASCPNAEVVKK